MSSPSANAEHVSRLIGKTIIGASYEGEPDSYAPDVEWVDSVTLRFDDDSTLVLTGIWLITSEAAVGLDWQSALPIVA